MRRILVICFLFCMLSVLNVIELAGNSQESHEGSLHRYTIYVPGDQSTIQDAIDASEDGDVIILSEGSYVENINFNGKAITLESSLFTTQDTSNILQTIINKNKMPTIIKKSGKAKITTTWMLPQVFIYTELNKLSIRNLIKCYC